jgi:hypothetical protein
MDVEKKFKEYGFARLKGRSWSYTMIKPHIIIGRSCGCKDTGYTWQVDLDLAPVEKVSKQHAAILYNFQLEKFEIMCLSKKKSVKVNGRTLTKGDKPFILDGDMLLSIGGETIHFSLPKIEDGVIDNGKMDLED